MIIKKWITLAVVAGSVVLAGCYPGYKETVEQVEHTKETIHQKEQTYNPPPPPVMEKTGAYVDTRPVSLDRPPYWLKRRVSIHGANLPVTFYIEQVLDGINTNIQFDNDLDRGKLISVNYRGTIKGALNRIATKSDYAYHINNKTGDITWTGFVTKTFDVSFLPGHAKYEVGGKQGGGDSLASGGAGGGGSSGGGDGGVTINYTGVDLSKSDQYSSLTGDLSIWKDIETTVKNLLSKEGKVTVSQATTTITVHDHPENVEAIERFVEKMNKELSKQVRILVQVLNVKLSHNFDYGINWNLVRNFGSLNSLALTGSLASNAAATNSLSPLALTFTGHKGKWGGTDQIIQALSNQGKVSLVTQPTVTTLNNQVAEITIQNQKSYIQSVSNSVNENFSSSGVNPGVVTTGFNLYLLPKIQRDRIFLQVSTTISNLQSIREINAVTGEVSSNEESSNQSDLSNSANDDSDSGSQSNSSNTGSAAGSSSNSAQIIQIPEIDERRFNQRSVIPNGATLIIAGFKTRNHTANESKFLYTSLLGGKGGEAVTEELVLLITPVILNDGDTY